MSRPCSPACPRRSRRRLVVSRNGSRAPRARRRDARSTISTRWQRGPDVRFVRLVVDRFRGIQHADVTFGPGLNVLHGPNGGGKSTLAAAIRAALLLPAGSREASDYIPWQGDYTPAVQL